MDAESELKVVDLSTSELDVLSMTQTMTLHINCCGACVTLLSICLFVCNTCTYVCDKKTFKQTIEPQNEYIFIPVDVPRNKAKKEDLITRGPSWHGSHRSH